MKFATLFVWLLCASIALALTPEERKTIEHAKTELISAQKSGTTGQTETSSAGTEAQAATESANLADQKADTAVKQINVDMAKFKGHWGLNAIAFGFREL